MSRYRPAISIRTDLANPSAVVDASIGVPAYDAVVSRVEKYSITPRTLKSVTEFDSAYVTTSTVGGASASAAGSSYKPELYTSIEEYEFKGNTVMRYAIRADIIDSSTGDVLGLNCAVDKGSFVTSSKYRKNNAKAAILHDLEKDILIKAITSFVTPTISGTHPTTAVIDIFERNDGTSINRDVTTGHPIVHSVVLHFIPSERIVCVIDPSNFLFSNHLENDDFFGILTLSGLPAIRTLTVNKQIKLYTCPTNSEGSAFDQYRDCTDVAIKIAFGLNKHPFKTFSEYDSEESVKSHPVLVRISNQPNIDEGIIEDHLIPSRLKQASSLVCQETFSKLQYTLNTKEKVFNKVGNDALLGWFESAYLSIMTTEAEHDRILDTLKGLDDVCNTRIDGELRKCIGEVFAE